MKYFYTAMIATALVSSQVQVQAFPGHSIRNIQKIIGGKVINKVQEEAHDHPEITDQVASKVINHATDVIPYGNIVVPVAEKIYHEAKEQSQKQTKKIQLGAAPQNPKLGMSRDDRIARRKRWIAQITGNVEDEEEEVEETVVEVEDLFEDDDLFEVEVEETVVEVEETVVEVVQENEDELKDQTAEIVDEAQQTIENNESAAEDQIGDITDRMTRKQKKAAKKAAKKANQIANQIDQIDIDVAEVADEVTDAIDEAAQKIIDQEAEREQQEENFKEWINENEDVLEDKTFKWLDKNTKTAAQQIIDDMTNNADDVIGRRLQASYAAEYDQVSMPPKKRMNNKRQNKFEETEQDKDFKPMQHDNKRGSEHDTKRGGEHDNKRGGSYDTRRGGEHDRKFEKIEHTRKNEQQPEYKRQNNMGEKSRRGTRKDTQWIDDETWKQIGESIQGVSESLEYKWDESLDSVTNKIAEQKFDEQLEELAQKFDEKAKRRHKRAQANAIEHLEKIEDWINENGDDYMDQADTLVDENAEKAIDQVNSWVTYLGDIIDKESEDEAIELELEEEPIEFDIDFVVEESTENDGVHVHETFVLESWRDDLKDFAEEKVKEEADKKIHEEEEKILHHNMKLTSWRDDLKNAAEQKIKDAAQKHIDEEKADILDHDKNVQKISDYLNEHLSDEKKDEIVKNQESVDSVIVIEEFTGSDSVKDAAAWIVDKASHHHVDYDTVDEIAKKVDGQKTDKESGSDAEDSDEWDDFN